MRTENAWTRSANLDPNEGARQARIIAAQIERGGEQIGVTTPANGSNGSAALGTRQIAFLPQPISPSTLTRLQFEGAVNVGGAITLDFLCAGTSQVAKGDVIGPYDGAQWQVLGTPPERCAGVTLLRHAIAQRQQ